MGQFLRKYNLPQLEQHENDNLSNPLTFKGMELTKNYSLKKKSLSPYGFTGIFYEMFKEDNTNSTHSLPENKKEENTFHFIF